MKKIVLIVAIAGLALAACKKDRVCSCKDYTTVNGSGATSFDYDVTMKSVSRRTAFNACVHSKTSTTTGTIVVDEDVNCSLK